MNGAILHGVLNNSAISIYVSERAMTYLDERGKPVYVGMELYFTHFMMKNVVFSDQKPDNEVTKITDEIYLYFTPLQTKRCSIKELKGDKTDLIEIPVKREGALVPKYIKIDYKNGEWLGDFTWKSGSNSFKPLSLNFN